MPEPDQLRIEIASEIYGEGGLVTLLTANIDDEIAFFASYLEKELRAMRRRGLSDDAIRRILLDDIAQGGQRYFGPFRTAIVAQVNTGIAESAEIGKNVYLKSKGYNMDRRKWRVTHSKGGPCPDCSRREGREESIEVWETIGTPRSGWSVCREHCLCSLDPVGVDSPNEVKIED